MPRLEIVHKHQARLNDCWYACIQMIRTWKHDGAKTKAVGAGVRAHRGRGLFGGGFWGWTLGKHSPQWQAILDENELIDVGWDVGTNACASVQHYVDQYGPLIVGGDFGKVGRLPGTSKHVLTEQGHYIVVAGTSGASDIVHVNDPWHTRPTDMAFTEFRRLIWLDGIKTIVANAP